MKVSEAINVLKMFSTDAEVELVFPDVIVHDRKPRVPTLSEGAMALLPMFATTEENDQFQRTRGWVDKKVEREKNK
jgi:hypothetical protein